MANLIQRPVIVDTPGSAMVFTDKIRVIYVKWLSPSGSPGDLAEIQDLDSKTLWKGVCPGPNYDSGPQRIERWWNTGFKVPTLGSGTLYVDWA